MKHVENFLQVLQSKDLWYNFDANDGEGEIINDEELKARLESGALKDNQVSSNPDLFPVFGDIKKAKEVWILGVENWVDTDLPCIIDAKGFYNVTKSSCFIDSPLIAMFLLRKSYFMEKLIVQDLVPDWKEIVCDNEEDRDLEVRYQIQNTLRQTIYGMLTGSTDACTMLRAQIGKDCNPGGRGDKFTKYSDPFELYQRLMNALNYNPITIAKYVTRTADPFATSTHNREKREDEHVTALPPLNIGDPELKHISYPGSWNGGWIEVAPRKEIPNDTELFVRTNIEITEADVIVVNLGRRDFESESETAIDKRKITFDLEIKIDNVGTYALKAIVYVPSRAHWATFLRCGHHGWFKYDDLNVKKSVLAHAMDEDEVMEIAQERAAIFFYYKT